MRTSCLAASLVTPLLAVALRAQQPAVLVGVVTNLNGVPLAGVEVAVVAMSIEAIEAYRGPAEIPPRFRQRDTACGLIVIWTREPPPKRKEPAGTA